MSVSAWPVILHQSLEKTEIGRLLRQKNFKLRISDNISGSVIFPMSGVAFMIVNLKDCVKDEKRPEIKPEIWESIDKFSQVHRRCYILALAACHKDKEQNIFHEIQMKYIQTNLQMIPVHNPAESLQAMLSIAKLLCKPTSDVMTARFEGVLSQAITEDVTGTALSQLGISGHEIQYIQDGIGNLAQLSRATREDLLNCSLDTQTVDRVLSVFKK